MATDTVMVKGASRGRPPVQNRRIVAELRRDVLRGVLLPGGQLPVRTELLTRFGVSNATLQAAIDQLRKEGLLRVAGTRGTFVEATLPHLHDVALVVIPGIEKTMFAKALSLAAGQLASKHGFRIREYSIDVTHVHRAELERLCDDTVNHRFSAMIFWGDMEALRGTPILMEPGIDRIVIEGTAELRAGELPKVQLDLHSARRRAIEYLQQRGRNRIAHIGFASMIANPVVIERQLRQWQPNLRPYWLQLIPECEPALRCVATNIVSLLMHLEGENRPDALVIHDDNLVVYAVAGLLSAGTAVPRELELVAHTNFPLLANSPLPLKRIGFDCHAIMAECIKLIEQLRAQEEVADPAPMMAVFENE